MKIITKVFYDLDRPNTAPTTPLVKEEKNFPNKHLPPSDKARISSEFYKLRADIQEKPFTPEDSAKERDRIIALLNTLEFHRHLQVVFDAIITTQFVPKELIQA